MAASTAKAPFEADQAFELAFGLALGAGIELALAALAEIARGEIESRAASDRLGAALLDEGPPDRRLAVLAFRAPTGKNSQNRQILGEVSPDSGELGLS